MDLCVMTGHQYKGGREIPSAGWDRSKVRKKGAGFRVCFSVWIWEKIWIPLHYRQEGREGPRVSLKALMAKMPKTEIPDHPSMYRNPTSLETFRNSGQATVPDRDPCSQTSKLASAFSLQEAFPIFFLTLSTLSGRKRKEE